MHHYNHPWLQTRQWAAADQHPVTRLKRWQHAGPYDAYYQIFPTQEDRE
jgi:hypothetical protein